MKTLTRSIFTVATISASMLSAYATTVPVSPDTAGAWECTVVDNMHYAWIHEGPNAATTQAWALSLCRTDSTHPKSCHLVATGCHLVDVTGKWRCFAADYRERVRWQATVVGPRWHAIHVAYQQCYRHSRHPNTCYVNPAICIHRSE